MHSGMLRHGPALVRPPTDNCCLPGRMRISPTRPNCAKPTPGDETLQQMQQRQKEALRRQWKQLARQAKTDLETFSRRHGKRAGALMDGLEPVTFEECDYTDFLRRFGAQNEVLQLSEDEFDLIYYTYGLRTYGNVPLVEPLEYRDDKRIRNL